MKNKILNLFKKNNKKPPFPADKTVSPYFNAKRAWNTYTGGIIAEKNLWKYTSIASICIAVVSIYGCIHIGSQSKFIPYLIALPQQTNIPIAVGHAVAGQVDTRVIQATLNQWIYSARLITPDIAIERRAIFDVYAHLSPDTPAITKMNEEFSGDNDHFRKAATETRDIQVIDILQQSPETWQIDWIETVRDRTDGSIKGEPYKMKALVNLKIVEPDSGTSEEQIRQNPLGLYIPDFSWSKQSF